MKIYEGLENPFNIPAPVVTTGTFDGVHVGHRKIIQRLNQIAADAGGESVVVTFEPHPRLVLFPDDNQLRLLSTLSEKIRLLEEAGVQNLVVVPFTKTFSRLTSQEYIRDILREKIGVRCLVIGYDHHFGRNREGNISQLAAMAPEMGFEVEEIPAQDIDDIRVSSTKIRNALQAGDVGAANIFLTYHYSIHGTVVHGRQLGRTMGFPTANIRLDDPLKLVPGNGVYAVKTKVDNIWRDGMLNIGVRPTVDGENFSMEVHILDWEGNIYDREITIRMIDRIREERKFSGLDELKEQLISDKQTAIKKLATA